jgi:hypothetical protein
MSLSTGIFTYRVVDGFVPVQGIKNLVGGEVVCLGCASGSMRGSARAMTVSSVVLSGDAMSLLPLRSINAKTGTLSSLYVPPTPAP